MNPEEIKALKEERELIIESMESMNERLKIIAVLIMQEEGTTDKNINLNVCPGTEGGRTGS